MGIDFRTRSIIYSDALNIEKALKIKAQCDEIGFTCGLFISHNHFTDLTITVQGSFGIGTFLTNDFARVSDNQQRSRALNMVIKLAEVNGEPCIKISDEIMKVCTGLKGSIWVKHKAYQNL